MTNTRTELVQRGKRGIHSQCHPERIHYAHGKCKPCYYREKYKDSLWRERQKELTKQREQTPKTKSVREQYKSQNKEFIRTQFFFHEYHFTKEEWLELYAFQKGCCFICGAKLANRFDPNSDGKMAAFDHCHKTGLVRGLLCRMPCNKMLGGFYDDANLIRKALEYMENPPATKVFNQKVYTLPGKVGTKLRRKRWREFGHLDIRNLGLTKALESQSETSKSKKEPFGQQTSIRRSDGPSA